MFEHLYIHVPFCDEICFYCDFFKIRKSKEEMIEEFLDCLVEEIDKKHHKWNLKTIYIGGGTPNALNNKQLEKMFTALERFTEKIQEYTVELNPEAITEKQLQVFKRFGINRLSIGVQCFNDDLLKKVNRKHDVKTVESAFQLCREEGFKNISIDLIYNLFNQTIKDIYVDLEYIEKLKPEHISWYSLILKPNTVWGKTKIRLPNNDYEFDKVINSKIQSLGYSRYEISNYCSKESNQSLHNLAYWTNKSFDAIGPSGAGFNALGEQKFLFHNSRNYKDWILTEEFMSEEDYFFQILMMGLRLTNGLDLDRIKDANSSYQYYKDEINEQIKSGNLEIKNNHLKCTAKGLAYLDTVLINILKN